VIWAGLLRTPCVTDRTVISACAAYTGGMTVTAATKAQENSPSQIAMNAQMFAEYAARMAKKETC
jgi:hypothetical protein